MSTLADIVNRDDIWVIEPAGGARFLIETRLVVRDLVTVEVHVDGFDCNRAMKHRVASAINCAHRAFAKRIDHFITAEFAGVCHRGLLLCGLYTAEHRAPRRMARFCRTKLKVRGKVKNLLKFFPAP